jgi:hypothetical protein
MHIKWILFFLPIAFLLSVTPGFGQTSVLTNAVPGTDNQLPDNFVLLPDTTTAAIPVDSTYANFQIGWNKIPGQMPVYVPALLPNSMPILTPPPVDENMVAPSKIDKAKSPESLDWGGK